MFAKLLLIMVWAICTIAFSDDEYRSFRDTNGREIKAKIVKYNSHSGKVTVEREGGRTVTVPADIFSESDQAYIREWLLAQDFLSNSKLRISIRRIKGKFASNNTGEKQAKAPCHFEIDLDNRSDTGFENIRLSYCIYIDNAGDADGQPARRMVSDELDSISLPSKENQTIETEIVEPFQYYSITQETYTDDEGFLDSETLYKEIGEDEVEGVWVRVHFTTATSAVFSRDAYLPKSLPKDHQWNDPSYTMVKDPSNTPGDASGSRTFARFKKHDGDGDGRISFEEFLAEKRRQKGDKFTEKVLETRFRRLDLDGDGYIGSNEWK